MSLDQKDAATIRNIFIEGIEELVIPRFESLEERMLGQERATHALKTQVETEFVAFNNRVRLLSDDVKTLGQKIGGLQSDVEEIYDRIVKIEKNVIVDIESMSKLSKKDQVLQLNAAVVALAHAHGVTLPR
jgi:hypothetical protein